MDRPLDDLFHKCLLVACLCLTVGCGDERKPAGGDRTAPPDEGGATALDADTEAAQDAAPVASDAGSAEDGPAESVNAATGPIADASVSSAPSVARGDPSASYWDLRVRGVGLGRFEGKEVVVRMGRLEEPGERLAAGSARIANGSFELFFPQAWEQQRYKSKLGYIDVDGNGRCDAGHDVLFMDSRATKIDVLELRVDTSMRTTMDFGPAFYPDEDCAALNASWPLP